MPPTPALFSWNPQRVPQPEHSVTTDQSPMAGAGRGGGERPSFQFLLTLLADMHAELQAENELLLNEVGQIHGGGDQRPVVASKGEKWLVVGKKPEKNSSSLSYKRKGQPHMDSPKCLEVPEMPDLPPAHCVSDGLPPSPLMGAVSPAARIRSGMSDTSSPGTSPQCRRNKVDSTKMQGFVAKFQRLETDSKKRMRSNLAELDSMLALHEGKSWVPGSLSLGEVGAGDVAKALNESRDAEELGAKLTFETFVDLMTLPDYENSFDQAIAEKITAFRQMYAKDDMTRMVARFSHVSAADMVQLTRTSVFNRKLLDPISLCVIILNALTLAVAADGDSTWGGWDILEFGFTSFFVLELLLKLHMYGCCEYFAGADCWWNFADVVFVFFAVMDTVLVLVQMSGSNLQLFTVIRLVRLARITRVIRVLRFKVFKELLLMIRGIIAGLRTLFWAIILLLFVIFVLGIFMRQTIGQWCDPQTPDPDIAALCMNPHLMQHAPQLFSTVMRSCFTMFRCFTEGCVSSDGTPLMIHIYENGWFGLMLVILYMLCFLAVTFGLFNLIMAVFVENTMAAAKVSERKRHRMRDLEHVYVARKLQRLVLQFCTLSNEDTHTARPSQRLSWEDAEHISGSASSAPGLFGRLFRPKKKEEDDLPQLEAGLDVKITRDLFRRVVDDPQMETLLDDLEVNVADHMSLFDVLDADGSGSLDVPELIMGIMKLRGTADKGDVVATLLAVRAMQKDIQELEGLMLQMSKAIENSLPTRSTPPVRSARLRSESDGPIAPSASSARSLGANARDLSHV